MLVWYIHGAGASERSFAWLDTQLGLPAQFFSYSLQETTTIVTARLAAAIAADGRPAILLGHSLGGVVAVLCASLSNVAKIVTICAPFGGVRHADMLAFFNKHSLISDLRSYGPLLSNMRNIRLRKPHLAIVGSCGLPFLGETNDGVITVSSQTAFDGARYEIVPLNHFEVLLSQEVADLILGFTHELIPDDPA